MLVEQLKNYCKKKGVSFAEFERESGVGERTASRWGTNSPSLKKVMMAKRNQLLSEPTPTPPPDPAVMQKISLSDKNIRERYYELTRQERQMLWRNMVESIVVRENVVDITWRQG